MEHSERNGLDGQKAGQASQRGSRKKRLPQWLHKLVLFFWPGTVSSIHYQDARERYWILWREIEIRFNTLCAKFNLSISELTKDPDAVDDFINKQLENLAKHMQEKFGVGDEIAKMKELEKKFPQFFHILYLYKILVKDKELLTRHEKDLNILWRDLNFIRIRLLNEEGLPADRLANYLDFCRGDAIRLGVQDLPDIKELVHEAAIELDGTEEPSGGNRQRNRRTLRAITTLLSRLTNIRTQRIHDQRHKKITYQFSFFILLVLSAILIYSHDVVLQFAGSNVPIKTAAASAVVPIEDAPQMPTLQEPTSWKLVNAVLYLPELIRSWMAQNSLFFVFFSGLVGGFLSAVMRLGAEDVSLGRDAYYKWYVLTKPVVGALSATILYVIVVADFVPLDVINEGYIEAIRDNPVGAKSFAFGFLMGFSERVIMPKLQ